MTEAFASGWENPDHHPPLTERPRPMFDASGRPVTEAPPPDPAPELDNFLRPGDIQPAAVPGRPDYAAGAVVTGGRTVSVDLGEKVRPLDHQRQLAEIRQVAQDAADTDSRVAWLAALAKIIELSR